MDFIEPCFGIGHNLSLICQMTSEDIKHQLIIETELFFIDFFLPGMDASYVYVRALALGCFCSLISTQTFRRALTASADSYSEIKTEWPFSKWRRDTTAM